MEMPEIVSIAYDTDRKITGIGEPPTIPTAGAIANAVYNAIGVRIRGNPNYAGQSPRRPRLVEKEGDEKMENFAYVNAADVEQVPSLLSDDWSETKMIAGGTDLLGELKGTLKRRRRWSTSNPSPVWMRLRRMGRA